MEPRVIQVAQIWDLEHNPVNGRIYSPDGIAPTLMTPTGGYFEPKILLEMEERRFKAKRIQSLVDSGKIDPKKVQFLDCYNQSVSDDVIGTIHTRIDGANHYFVTEPTSCASRKRGDGHKIETRNDELANCVTSIDTDSMVREPQVLTPLRTEEGRQLRKQGIEKFSNRALYPREDGVSNTITSIQEDNLLQEPKRRYRIRKLTEREVFRLMDVSEEDIDKIQGAGISKTAQYKLAGNSIVVSCLYHIFRKMFIEPECESLQLSLF